MSALNCFATGSHGAQPDDTSRYDLFFFLVLTAESKRGAFLNGLNTTLIRDEGVPRIESLATALSVQESIGQVVV